MAETAGLERIDWRVTGMTCAGCARRIERAVAALPGVSEVAVSRAAERLTAALGEGSDAAAVAAEIRALGFGLGGDAPPQDAPASEAPEGEAPAGSRARWRVTGMDCGACAARVRGAVEGLPGVSDVEVSMMGERLRLRLGPEGDPEAVERAVRGAGYGIARDGAAAAAPPWYRRPKARLVAGTGALLAAAWAGSLLLPEGLSRWPFVAACLLGLVPVAGRAARLLRTGQPFTIEMLMTIAAGGALVIGAEAEAAMVVFLFAVGELLEGLAADRARAGIRALGELVPKTARLLEDGALTEVSADSLRPGQRVLIRPGDRVPADGEIVEGVSGLDESPVTGESVPVARGPGETVRAGTVNTEAALTVRVTAAAEDNTISRIIRLVEEAEAARAPTERFIDRFSRWYMPLVVGLAALVAVGPPLALGAAWGEWVYRGLALLLIGCPCALVISVPASVASTLSAGARQGLLLKGGAVVEAAAEVTHVAFDKTGTLTRGRPAVTHVEGVGAEAAQVLARAAAVERGSAHPLAEAVLARAAAEGVAIPPARAARALPGRGVEAEVAGTRVAVVSAAEARGTGALSGAAEARAAALEAEGRTVVAVLEDGALTGLIALRDEPRADAAEGVAALRSLGLSPVMLTGDNARTAEAIGGALGLEHRAGLLPADKVGEIRALATRARVMMIGDGINDAPALAAAQVGIAMGSGTDVALETADGALMRSRVADAARLVRLSRAAMCNIRQNIVIALGLKGVFLVTTVAGVTGLWPAILADTGATVLVTLNALRLLGFARNGRSPST